MLDFILGNKVLVGSVLTGAGTLLGYKMLSKDAKKFFEEGFDVYEAYKEAGKDGKYTVQEMKEIAKQSGEFAAVALILLIKVRKVFKKK